MPKSSVRLDRLVDMFVIDMKARTLAPRTISTYTTAARSMTAWLAEKGITTTAGVDREAVTGYIAALAERRSPAGVSVAYRALQQFFKWADETEDEITPNPMAKMRPPVVPEAPVPVLRTEQIKALWTVVEGKDFESRRDAALIRLMLDTGIRIAEATGLQREDVSVAQREAWVMGKGRRPRIAPFGHATARALSRYELVRERHKSAELPGYWLALRRSGPLTADGIAQMLGRRGQQAGIEGLHAHQLRHTWAHHAKGVIPDDEMMRLAGWKSRQMLNRYAASTADERARETGKRTALGDRL